MDPSEASVYTAVVIVCVVAGAVLLSFLAALSGSRRAHLRVQREQLLAEIGVLEGERSRVSQDLHDDIGPLVSAIKLHLKLAWPGHPGSDAHMERSLGYLDELNARLRGIARNLTPRVLASKGLEAALRQFLDDYQELTPMAISFECALRRAVGTDAALQVYRVVQELVQNAAKHAGATMMLVRLTEAGKNVHLLCKDNGRGFAQPVPAGSGQGLANLRSRVALLGGRMQCVSTPAHGTEYFFTLPLS
ncbi:MAG: putative signal transduction histidine kinase [Flaviaesturariibacter sp.]|nr:putative signal transduction histidine kinase [Flaviaesturariibacter sp.]